MILPFKIKQFLVPLKVNAISTHHYESSSPYLMPIYA